MTNQFRQKLLETSLIALCVLAASPNSQAASELSLLCPCSAERISQTAVSISAGIRNTGSETSGNLRLILSSAISKPIGSRSYRAYVYLPEHLKPNYRYRSESEWVTAFNSPSDSRLSEDNSAVLLVELHEEVDGEWVFRDQVRLDREVEFSSEEVGGESAREALYIEGVPELPATEGEATVVVPKITNSSLEPVVITRAVIGHKEGPEFWGTSFRYGLNAEDLSVTIDPQSSITNLELTGDYTPPDSDKPFTQFSLRSVRGVEVWQTIEARAGNQIPFETFSVASIDFLSDEDDDGVSDFNEDLEGTDPIDETDTPGKVYLDVLALYTPAVETLYDGEPAARILHEIEWGNQALKNSGINAEFRLVDVQSVDYTESLDTQVAIDAVQAQSGVFEGIDAKREAAGADLLVLYLENDPDDGICGRGSINAYGQEGDFGFDARSEIVSVVAAGCRANTLAHEFGHNMGLNHSVRDEDSDSGTFSWSRGHGQDGLFVTIMAGWRDYDVSGPDIQYFSNPDILCSGYPCGVDRLDQALGADAALSIRTVMHQIADLAKSKLDSDADGQPDEDDNCPNVANEDQLDTDSDLTGDACDTDDDGDGLSDDYELKYGLNPLDASDALEDLDSDGIQNFVEHMTGSDPSNPFSPAIPDTVSESAQADFNGDGKADLLLRSSSGSWWLYQMDGATIASQGRISATGDINWEPQSFADFNGDNKSDILIRHKELGIWWLYTMDGNTIVKSERVLATRDLSFQPLSFKDTNNDGNADILLRHTDGRWWRYGMSGATILSNSAVGATRDTNFEPVSYDDFNGDGSADILVRNKTNGVWYKYELAGATILSGDSLNVNRNLSWEAKSTDDFDGSDQADLLLRNNASKKWYLYLLNGYGLGNAGSLRVTNDASWHPISTADFNGDGNADLVVRSENGSWWMYSLNGLTVIKEGRLPFTSDTDWRPVSFADFNGDGRADALIRNVSTGGWWLYSLDGQTVLSSEKVNATPKLDWELQP